MLDLDLFLATNLGSDLIANIMIILFVTKLIASLEINHSTIILLILLTNVRLIYLFLSQKLGLDLIISITLILSSIIKTEW